MKLILYVMAIVVFGASALADPQAQPLSDIPFSDLRNKDYSQEKIIGFAKALSGRGNSIIFLYLDSERLPRDQDDTLQEIEAAARQLRDEGYSFFEVWAASSKTGMRGLEIFIDGYQPPGYDNPSGGFGGLTANVVRYVKEQHKWHEGAKDRAGIED